MPSVDQRGARITPLVFFSPPLNGESVFSWETAPDARLQMHVAGKDVALESEGLGFSRCTTLCKSLFSLSPSSSCENSCLSNLSVCLSGMSLQR